MENYDVSRVKQLMTAITDGDLDTIKSLHEQGVKQDIDAEVLKGFIRCEVVDRAALNGNVENMKYLHEVLGYDFGFQQAGMAASKANMECLKYIHDTAKFTKHRYVFMRAVESDNAEIFTFLLENDYPLSEEVSAAAIRKNDVELLKKVCDMGSPLEENACTRAAMNGNLEILKYLILEKGAECTAETTFWAAEGNHLECLQYLHDNECPWDAETTFIAKQKNNTACYDYANNNGCPEYSFLKRKLNEFTRNKNMTAYNCRGFGDVATKSPTFITL